MKKLLISLAAVLLAFNIAQASDEVIMAGTPELGSKKLRCTILGNMKIKLTGLDAAGSISKGWFKTQKIEGSCRKALKSVKAQVSELQNILNSVVKVTRKTYKTEVWRDNGRDILGGHDHYYRDFSYVECQTVEQTTALVTLSTLNVNISEEVKLRRTEHIITDISFGPCR
ncbi:MAG: hypothetical protein HN509_12335 [Halobacteriovoraceae bacterium]|jgi:hypothetical protein|nr:hypothetical protein [Halobacteriovoraceae bacterium]MBT5092704.1 hypothetical protein [Halobacteriovoraceae bacterium]